MSKKQRTLEERQKFYQNMQQGKYVIPKTFTDQPAPTTTVEQPEPAVQSASQSSTSGLKNLWDKTLDVGANVWNKTLDVGADVTTAAFQPSYKSSEDYKSGGERSQLRLINALTAGLIENAVKRSTGETPEWAKARTWKEDKLGSAADFISEGLGWVIGGGKFASVLKAVAPKLAAKSVPQLAKGATTGQKIARTAKVAGEQAKEGVVVGTGLMGAEIGFRETLNPQDYTWKQNLADLGYAAASGAVIDPLAYGAASGVGRLFGRGQTPSTQPTPTTRQRSAEDLEYEWMEASNLTPNASDLFDYLIKQKGWTIDDYRAVGYTEEQLQNLNIFNKLGIPNPTAPTIENALRLRRGQTPTGAPVVARSSKQQKSLDDIINKPPETQQTLDQILNDLTPEINRRLDPPLTNKANLAKWLKKYALPNESLSKIQKRPVEELRQLAIETRKNLDTRETAIEIAKEKNIDLDALFKQADAEKNINVQTLDNIINPQPRVETETPSPNQELLDKAMQYLKGKDTINMTKLQKELNLNYSYAASLMDELEARGIVSSYDGTSPRKVLINRNQQPETQQTQALETQQPQSQSQQPTTTTKDVKSDEYLFSEQRRNDISEKIKKQFDRSIKDYEDAMKNAVDPRAREAGAKFAKGQRMAQAAAIREEIQGDLLIPIEGGLTAKKLDAKIKYLKSDYEGKEVIVDGREGVIEKTVFGNTIIKFKDGSKVSYDYETLQKSNFQPKVDIEEVIRQQTDRKAIYDLETEAKQLKLTDRAINTLDNLEQQMRDFLKDSKNRLSSNPVDQYAAYAGIMAVKILKGTIKAADFTAELVKEFGEDIRPYASQILQKTSQIIKQQLNNAPASQQTPNPTTIPVSQSLPNPPSTVPASQQKPSRITATVSKRLRKKGSVNVVSNLVNNTNNTTPAAITPIQYNKLNSFDKHTRDVYRNLQHALGQQTADKYLNMLDDAKKENLDMQQFWLKWLEDEVIKKYNIKRGSKSSKLVQMFGEQKITLAELQQRAPKNWQNIVDADKAFRFAYDKLIDEVNATRLQIHGLDVRIKDINQDPNLTAAEKKQQVDDIVNQATNEGKLIPKRTNYYRHFKDNGALYSYKNIYDTVSKIGDLTEEFRNMTNSKILTSFVSFAKKRMGNKTKYDAVAGFLDYIPAASYAVKIDPMIKPFRELGDFIRQDAQTRNIDVGDLADYLNEFADDLANVRQSELDKSVSGIESFKLTLSAAHLITNMVKRNLLVGNIGTVLVQGSNLANAFGYTKQYAVVGIGRTLNEIFNKSARLSNQSTYLRERGFAKEYRRLDDRILMQPLNFANWLMETADMTTAKIIWNSAYAQGKAKKVADPMRYADDIARKSTAGRGVGEMPFINKGKVFNIVAPFQYDVANTLQVYRDIGINKKDVMGLASLMIAAYVSNEILKAIRGSGGQLDLINAFKEASKKDLTPVQRGGRVLGELFSNIPLGQTVAAFDGIFPKYGGKRDILGFSVDTLSREDLFGAGDPTRFGEDLLLFNALKQPQYFVLPPFGGAQIRKTQEAITALAKGKSEEDGQTRFLLDKSNAWRNLNTALFGIYTSPEGRRYLKEDQRMLSVQQSKMLDSLPKEQQKLFFEYTQNERRLNTIKSKATSITNDPTKTVEQKTKEINKLSEEYIKVSNDFQKFIAEQNKK